MKLIFNLVTKIILIVALVIIAFFVYKTYFFKPYAEMPWVMRGLPRGYTNSNPYYSIRYPDDWKVDNKDDITTFSKDNTSLRIIAHLDGSSSLKYPTICQYPDSTYKGNLVIKSGDYVEFKSNNKIYRTTQVLPVVGSATTEKYMKVCYKGDDGKFTNKINNLNIDYIFNKDLEAKDIELMNRMVSSLQF